MKSRTKQRLLIACGLLWKRSDIPLANVLSTLNWLNSDLRDYYKGLTDWVEDYENA